METEIKAKIQSPALIWSAIFKIYDENSFFDWNRLPYPKYTRNTYLVPFLGIYQRKTAKNRRKTAQFLLFGGYKIRQTSEPVII